MRGGMRVVHAPNHKCEQVVRTAVAKLTSMSGGAQGWYPGWPVIVPRKDIVKLFNGDIGVRLPDDHGSSHA